MMIQSAPPCSGLPALPARLSSLLAEIEAAFERRRQRRLLLTLDEVALKDFGVSRCDAEREAAKGWRR